VRGINSYFSIIVRGSISGNGDGIGLRSNIQGPPPPDSGRIIDSTKRAGIRGACHVSWTHQVGHEQVFNFRIDRIGAFHVRLERFCREPQQQLQGTIDRVIEVLQTIRSPHDINKNRNALRQLLLTRFDFVAMAQQSLGNRWSELNGKEEEFVSAFTDFVENGYMSTLGSYRGEKVV
jgi:MlaC protein